VQFTSGNTTGATCGENLSGVENNDPSLSGVAVRCDLVPGEDPNSFTLDTSVDEAYRTHFNLDAFQRPTPEGGVGSLGNAPVGLLRHPGWQNWDFTLARRIPINVGRGGSLRVQAQFYNMWNLVQFQRMATAYTFSATVNTNPETGQFDQTINPFNFGLTVRLDY
jgi:hypothetical protein